MRVIRIDALGVSEIEMDFDEFLDSSDVEWNYIQMDGYNDIWVEGLRHRTPGADIARVGRRHVSLPAYIVGFDGDFCDDTTFSLAKVEAMTTWTSPVRRSA